MRAAIVLAALLVGGVAGAEDSPARPSALMVSYRSETAVYVSAGRAAGLAVGDRLAVMADKEKVAELEVAFLAEHSSSCTVISESRPVKPGDRLVRLGAKQPAASAADGPREITVTPNERTGTVQAPTARREEAPRPRLYGGVSAGYGTFQDSSGSGRDVTEQLARADVTGRSLGGLPLDVRLRGSGRQIERENLGGLAVAPSDSRHRLYEASIAWTPVNGRYAAAAGRLGAYPFGGLGYLDGVAGQLGVTPAVHLGAFAGRTPDALDVGVPSGAKYGAFVRLGRRSGPSPGDFVVSAVREHAGAEISREYVAQTGQVRSGRLWLYEAVEIDFNRGWRLERAGRSVDLSEARAQLGWRASHSADVSVSYDRSRNYWTALTSGIPTETFDRRLRQTFRGDLRVTRPGGLGFWTGASVRSEEGREDVSLAAYGGVRTPSVASLDLSFEGSYYDTPDASGALATVRAGRSLRGGHRLDLSYTANRYQAGASGSTLSQWIRGSGYAQLPGGVFGRADLEYAIQDPLPGVRGFFELGYRF